MCKILGPAVYEIPQSEIDKVIIDTTDYDILEPKRKIREKIGKVLEEYNRKNELTKELGKIVNIYIL